MECQPAIIGNIHPTKIKERHGVKNFKTFKRFSFLENKTGRFDLSEAWAFYSMGIVEIDHG